MDNRINYIAFGDSLTSGVGASTEKCSFTYLYFQTVKQTSL